MNQGTGLPPQHTAEPEPERLSSVFWVYPAYIYVSKPNSTCTDIKSSYNLFASLSSDVAFRYSSIVCAALQLIGLGHAKITRLPELQSRYRDSSSLRLPQALHDISERYIYYGLLLVCVPEVNERGSGDGNGLLHVKTTVYAPDELGLLNLQNSFVSDSLVITAHVPLYLPELFGGNSLVEDELPLGSPRQ